MIKLAQRAYDRVRDAIQGGDARRTRRTISGLRHCLSDLRALTSLTGTDGVSEAAAGHALHVQDVVSFLEERLALQEAVLRAGRMSDEDILHCMVETERERYGVLPVRGLAAEPEPRPRKDRVS